MIFLFYRIFTSRKRSLGQGNIFTPVCHSVHTGAACVVGACMAEDGGQGAGGMHGGRCMAGGAICGGGHAWWGMGACVAGDCAWWGACMAGGGMRAMVDTTGYGQ